MNWLSIIERPPFFSSLANAEPGNQLGAYDGLSMMLDQFMAWGVPYLAGRLYFADRDGMRELIVAIILGALAYIPICLYEIRFSPLLHAKVYGFKQCDFVHIIRFGGYRPMGFTLHGLLLGLWMSAATL